MEIVQATPELVQHVALNMRAGDYAEISATSWADGRAELAADLAARYRVWCETIYIAQQDGEPIAVFGWVPLWPGVWSLLMFATDAFPKVAPALTRFCCTKAIPALNNAAAARVECYSHATHETAHQWLKFLGLKPEADLRGYGRGGEDFIVFAWTRPPGGGMQWRRRGVVN